MAAFYFLPFPLKPAVGEADRRPCSHSGLNILLEAAVSTRALISGGLSHHPGA